MERENLYKHTSVLLHGYFRTERDMYPLAKNLEKLNHRCFLVTLPLTYGEIEPAACVFEDTMDRIFEQLKENEKVNLIGHSTGGLIIRKYLSNIKNANRINCCVQIATPNNGSELADIASNYLNIFTSLFKTLHSLQTKNARNIEFIKDDKIKIGAIAGMNSKFILGKILSEENDGRVTIKSVYHENLSDFIVLPYDHNKIHHMNETAKLVDTFIDTGRFKE